MAIIVETPFQNFTGLDGKPLTNGKVYIGQVGTDPTVFANQIPVFWDEALTIPASQPLTTNAGYIVRFGAPSRVYVATDYSISVKNASNILVYYISQFGAKNYVDADQLSSPSGAGLVGITPAASAPGAISTTVEKYVQKTLPRSIFDFMTDAQIDAVLSRTGLLDVGATVISAINTAPEDSTLLFPDGVYNMGNSQIVLSAFHCCHMIGQGFPVLKWNSLTSDMDAVTMIGVLKKRATLKNIKLDMNFTGQDGVKLLAGERVILERVIISQSRRDAFSVYCNNFDHVENLMLSDVLLEACGRNGVTLEVSGPNSAFINECVFSEVELRGVSLKEIGGCAVLAQCSGSTGAKISEIQWNACNFDAQRSLSVANGFDIGPNPMVLTYTPSGANIYEAWTINGGAWETTTGLPDFRSFGLIYLQDGAIARGWKMNLGVDGAWSTGGLNGKFEDHVVHYQKGPWRAPYANCSWKQFDAGPNADFFLDVALPNVPVINGGRREQSAWYELSIFGASFPSTDKKAYKFDIYLKCFPVGTDTYWSFIPTPTTQLSGADLFSISSVTIVNGSTGSTLDSTTPPYFARCLISTTSGWGIGGSDNTFHAIMTYKGGSHNEYSF